MLNLPSTDGGGTGGAAGVVANIADGQATAQNVSQIVSEMTTVIERIKSQAADAMTTWSGRAGIAFDGTHNDWNRAAASMNQLLDQIRAQLTNGFAGYEDQDASAASGFGINV
nr:WXG100 family type VII secretion target [Gordonia sp. 'Campus']